MHDRLVAKDSAGEERKDPRTLSHAGLQSNEQVRGPG